MIDDSKFTQSELKREHDKKICVQDSPLNGRCQGHVAKIKFLIFP